MLYASSADALEVLADELAGVIAHPLDDAMKAEWIAVPSQGMARWLKLRLARSLGATSADRHDGVAANLRIGFPGALRNAVLAAGRPDNEADPWEIDRLVWTVLAVLADHRDDPRLAHVTVLAEGATRYGRARRIADIFDRYGVHRPDMVCSWAGGADVDGSGQVIAEAAMWQPHLWRLVRERVGRPSPAEQLPDLTDRLRGGDLSLDLPPRLSFLGLTTLPGGAPFLDLVTAVAIRHEVHLLLFFPSPGLAGVVRRGVVGRRTPLGPLRSEDSSSDLVGHPLVRSWARPNREAVALLSAAEARGDVPPTDELPSTVAVPGSLLGRLQADLRAGSAPIADFVPTADDHSIEIHSCHGPSRQVEVLRDAILHRLAEDSTLREDDVLVVCPAIDAFAPLVEAIFGPTADTENSGGEGGGAPQLSYRITDRSLRDTYGMLGALAALVDLAGSRFASAAVIDFLALPPVRLRFDLDDDDLATIARWAGDSEVKWGLDGAHRVGWGIPGDYAPGSWRAVLDRILVGVGVSDDDVALGVGDVLPLGVEGGGISTAGRLADVIARLSDLADAVAQPRTIAGWCELLAAAGDEFLAAPDDAPWQHAALARLVQEIADQSTPPPGSSPDHPVELSLADVRRVLAERLGGAPRRPDFFRGGITVSSLTPLRGVPYRVICILGMDDGAFGATGADGDDLVAAAACLGDRDDRAETRQALLEAVLAAGDALLITRTGFNVVTNQRVPPAVPLAELNEAVLDVVAQELRESLSARLEIQHPRQIFDTKNFTPGAVVVSGSWSFDPVARGGAAARCGERPPPPPFLSAPLGAEAHEVIDLGDLQRVLEHPVRGFLRGRLQLHIPREVEVTSDDLPTTLDPLDAWKVAERLLESTLRGATTEEWLRREKARGTLPAGALGERAVEQVSDTVKQLVASARELGYVPGEATLRPIDLTLDAGTRLVGTVRVERVDRPGPVRVSYSRLKAKRTIAPWLDLLALVADDPTTDWQSAIVNRAENGSKIERLVYRPSGSDRKEQRERAVAALRVAVDCYRRSETEPIPLFSVLSKKLHTGKAGSTDWESFMGFADGDDTANALVFGEHDYESLLKIPAESFDPPGSATKRVERFARWLWSAMDESVVESDGSVEVGPNEGHDA